MRHCATAARCCPGLPMAVHLNHVDSKQTDAPQWLAWGRRYPPLATATHHCPPLRPGLPAAGARPVPACPPPPPGRIGPDRVGSPGHHEGRK